MSELIARIRRLSRLSQSALAEAAGTSRPTLSAYENGRKSPSLLTVERIASAAGLELQLAPVITFQEFVGSGPRVALVPDRLWRLPIDMAFATVVLPLHLSWSEPIAVDLRDRRLRARVYEIVLREGGAHDLLSLVDGALLVDLWEELVIPRGLRTAWQPAVDSSVNGATGREVA